MPWKSKPVPHVHDMPGPGKLGNQGALAGWVWTCGGADALDFELIEYRQAVNDQPAYAKWKDLSNGQILVVNKDN
jgi:hypothetical protein